MSGPQGDRDRSRLILVIVLLVLATLAKISWAMTSVGTLDTVRFYQAGSAMAKHGIPALYASDIRWNHTLSVSLFIEGLFRFAAGNEKMFVLWLRMPAILADVAVVIELLLLRRTFRLGWHWLMLAAISPINFIVCGFHGNLDGVLAAGVFLAFAAAVRGRPLMSGLWFGLACQVKVAPLLLAPALLAFWFYRGHFLRFSASFGTLGLYLLGSGIAVAGPAFVKNVFGYGSMWGFWGISELLVTLGITKQEVPLAGFADPLAAKIAAASKGIIIVLSCWLAWIGRKSDGRALMQSAAATLLTFFALTPGFAHQYMVWWFAVVLAAAPVWGGVLAAASTVLLGWYYSAGATTPFPWLLVNAPTTLGYGYTLCSLCVWAIFVAAAASMVMTVFRNSRFGGISSTGSKHTNPALGAPGTDFESESLQLRA